MNQKRTTNLKQAGPFTFVYGIMIGFVVGEALLAAVPTQNQSSTLDIQTRPIQRDSQGQLLYARDSHGNRVPDFSHCGYQGGGLALPYVANQVTVTPSGTDDTALIQAALDRVATLPIDADGFRGAVLLQPGTFNVQGQLRIQADGVVLRGSGPQKTTLIATGPSRRTLIQIEGRTKACEIADSRRQVTNDYVPIGAQSVTVTSTKGYTVGDRIMIIRPSTQAWLSVFSQARGRQRDGRRFNLRAGARDLYWDRIVTEIDGNQIHFDAPITVAMESQYGGGWVYRYDAQDRIQQVGVESLHCISRFNPDNPKDENHAWICIGMDHVQNGWVRGVSAQHFASSLVYLGQDTKWITVTDCSSQSPVSENGEFRRLTYYTGGQLTLFADCRAAQGRHDFTAGLNAPGPNVFYQCTASAPLSYCGPAEVWAAGTLYDQVTIEDERLWLTDLSMQAHGMGWAAANSMVWQCRAQDLRIDCPPTAYNWIVDSQGSLQGDAPQGTGFSGSLYEAQLQARLGKVTAVAVQQPTSTSPLNLVQQTRPNTSPPTQATHSLDIVNGRFVCNDRTVIGDSYSVNWWKGHIAPSDPSVHGVGITRYAPGMSGQGVTDDLDVLTERMKTQQIPFMQHWFGLWYDRRRDDHALDQRVDAQVRAPFYEMPWARSGQGQAWDGLSRYDLTQYNPWFFERLQTFAALAERKGLVLYHNYYNNHNVVESGAHWVDCPLRPVNCIQDTGLTEPPPFTDGRIYIADEFYDITHPERRRIHAAYIRKTLDELGDMPNVVHSVAFQYSGPLEFQRFYLDTVKQWQEEHGVHPKIALIAAKDVTDAILNDPRYEPLIDVIDTRYWQYTQQGDLYAPNGGQNRAFREMRRERFGRGAAEVPPATLPAQVVKQVREYKDRFPDKAVVCLQAGTGALPGLIAGAAQVVMIETDRAVAPTPYPLFTTLDRVLGDRLHRMPRFDTLADQVWSLAEPHQTYAVLSVTGSSFTLDLTEASGTFAAQWIQAATGALQTQATVTSGQPVDFTCPSDEAWLLVLKLSSNY